MSGWNQTYGMANAETAASFVPFYKKNLIRAKRPELRRSLVQVPRNSLNDFVEFDNNNNNNNNKLSVIIIISSLLFGQAHCQTIIRWWRPTSSHCLYSFTLCGRRYGLSQSCRDWTESQGRSWWRTVGNTHWELVTCSISQGELEVDDLSRLKRVQAH